MQNEEGFSTWRPDPTVVLFPHSAFCLQAWGDFGAGLFNGNAYWLAVGVRSNGRGWSFTPLSPRESLTPTAYALYATVAPLSDGEVTSAKILDGTIAIADLGNNSVNVAKITGLSIVMADLTDMANPSLRLRPWAQSPLETKDCIQE